MPKASSFNLVEWSQYHSFQYSALTKILNLSEGYLAYLCRVHRQQHHPTTTTPATMLIASSLPIPTLFLPGYYPENTRRLSSATQASFLNRFSARFPSLACLTSTPTRQLSILGVQFALAIVELLMLQWTRSPFFLHLGKFVYARNCTSCAR